MKITRIILGVLSVLAGSLASRAADNELAAAEKKDGWTLLFDGKSLDGWDGDPAVWRIENGCISGKAAQVGGNTFLIYKQPFSDFEFSADCMLIKGGGFTNSGIQYRSRVINKAKWVVGGYQADIGEGYWGTLYDEAGSRGQIVKGTEAGNKIKHDEWVHYEISAIGTKLIQKLNGVTTVDLDDQDPKAYKRGIFALQYHAPGQNFEARFKNIKIKNLGKAEEEK